MKALTIYPEFVWAICYLGKCVENRVWAPPEAMIGERFALHSGAHIGGRPGKSATRAGIEKMGSMAAVAGWSWMLDAEGGYASFARFPGRDLPIDMYAGDPGKLDYRLPLSTKAVVKSALVGTVVLGSVSVDDTIPWGVKGSYHWHLEDLQVFREPIAASGLQKFWGLSEIQESAVVLQQEALREASFGGV